MSTETQTNPAHAKIEAEIASSDVVLFMKGTPQFPMCGFSGQVVQILDYLGREMFQSGELLELMKSKGIQVRDAAQ